MTDPFDQFENESKGGAPALSFATIFGAKHPRAGQPTGFKNVAKGGILISLDKRQATDPDNNPKFWPVKPGQAQGDPKMVWVFTLQTQERDPANPQDNGVRSLWAEESSELLKAIMAAVREAKVKVSPGVGIFAAWVGERPSKVAGGQPAKLFAAKVTPAAETAFASEAAAFPQTAAQPTPAAVAPQQAAFPSQQAPAYAPQTYAAPAQQSTQPAAGGAATGNPFAAAPAPQQPAQPPQAAPVNANPFAGIG